MIVPILLSVHETEALPIHTALRACISEAKAIGQQLRVRQAAERQIIERIAALHHQQRETVVALQRLLQSR